MRAHSSLRFFAYFSNGNNDSDYSEGVDELQYGYLKRLNTQNTNQTSNASPLLTILSYSRLGRPCRVLNRKTNNATLLLLQTDAQVKEAVRSNTFQHDTTTHTIHRLYTRYPYIKQPNNYTKTGMNADSPSTIDAVSFPFVAHRRTLQDITWPISIVTVPVHGRQALTMSLRGRSKVANLRQNTIYPRGPPVWQQ